MAIRALERCTRRRDLWITLCWLGIGQIWLQDDNDRVAYPDDLLHLCPVLRSESQSPGGRRNSLRYD